jgi:L-aspartate oxidase
MKADFIIIGSGLAGLTSALTLSHSGKVLLLSKGRLGDGSSYYAQGGICAVADNDDVQSHIDDTMRAGAGHNDAAAVHQMVTNSPQAISWLENSGVSFDRRSDGSYALGIEGAHSRPRILHATDFTGRSIQEALLAKLRATERVTIWEDSTALDLIVDNGGCYGVEVLSEGAITPCYAHATILATGGTGQLYQWTTNPLVSTGDGVAIGIRAGAEVEDLEFIQFHPTALRSGDSPLFLISEAVRGAGAYIVNGEGERFLWRFDPRGEMASRDIVARAIFLESNRTDIFIDCRHLGEEYLLNHFPNIYRGVRDRGFDLATELVPVTPAAHYSCGGLRVDLDGRTSITNLFAYGEVARTGVHGANRLASNSLLEAVVFARRLSELSLTGEVRVMPRAARRYSASVPEAVLRIRRELQEMMWKHVGIFRSATGLSFALCSINGWLEEISGIDCENQTIAEVRNMVLVSREITAAARKRSDSLGAHHIVRDADIGISVGGELAVGA